MQALQSLVVGLAIVSIAQVFVVAAAAFCNSKSARLDLARHSSVALAKTFSGRRPFAADAKTMSFSLHAGREIDVVRNPSNDFLEGKGVFSWGTWSCDASKFPWTYDSNESCYLLEGQVTVTPTDGRSPATFGKGDFVTFPAGMSCEWDVSKPVKKHFMFF